MKQPSLQTEVVRVLQDKLHQIRLRNNAYSLRAYARKLGLSPAALSEILNGRRRVSQKIADRIANALLLNPEERQKFSIAASDLKSDKKKLRKIPVESRPKVELSMDYFQAVAEWQHFAILSLVETVDFQENAAWIAKRLGISKSVASQALTRLERLEMIERTPDGKLKGTGLNYHSPDEIASIALRRAHANNLELAKNSLEKDPLEKRDFTAVTMAIDPARLPEAKQMIRQFRQEVEAFLEGGEKKEVYKFCMQLIPLTIGDENEKPSE